MNANAQTSSLTQKLARLRLVILDCDGVLTDGRIIFNDGGSETKQFNVRDGHGIKLLMRAGVKVAIVSGRSCEALRRRAADLGIADLRMDAKEKLPVMQELIDASSCTWDETAVMGDDLVDLPAMARCGVSAAPADAHADVLRRADVVTQSPGGAGAVREFMEMILKASGAWETVTARYF